VVSPPGYHLRECPAEYVGTSRGDTWRGDTVELEAPVVEGVPEAKVPPFGVVPDAKVPKQYHLDQNSTI
jgi:hypothetical protein